MINLNIQLFAYGIQQKKNGQMHDLEIDADTLDGKHASDLQDKLVSGTNIKTINGNSVLGSGDLSITADDLKARYHLGAFDTVSGNVITRQTGYRKISDFTISKISQNRFQMIPTLSDSVSYQDSEVPYMVVNKTFTVVKANDVYNNLSNNIITINNTKFLLVFVSADYYTNHSADDFMADYGDVYIQYKLATSYTEKVIENQPLNTLDQAGSNWLRDEYLKQENLMNKSILTNVSSNNSFIANNVDFTLPAGTYTISTIDTALLSCNIAFFDSGGNTIITINDMGINAAKTFTLTSIAAKMTIYASIVSGTTNGDIMLNEGSHPYPYQEYNGAIVHKKDLPEKYNPSGSSKYIGYNAELNSSPTYVATFKDNYDLNGLCCSSTDSLNVGRSKSLLSYSAGGNDDVEALQDAFDHIDKSVGTAVRLEHGSHYMSFGYALSGYSYEHAYGSFLVLGYGLTNPTYVRMNNGTWTSSSLALTSDIPDVSGKLDKTGGTISGRIYGNTGNGLEVQSSNTGSWKEGITIYQASNNWGVLAISNSDRSYITALVSNSSAEQAYIERLYNGNQYVMNIPLKNGTIAMTSDIPSASSMSSVGRYPGSGGASDTTSYVTPSVLYYWNGANTGTSSNLAYCNKGAFGTVVTYDFIHFVASKGNKPADANKLTENGIYTGTPSTWNSNDPCPTYDWGSFLSFRNGNQQTQFYIRDGAEDGVWVRNNWNTSDTSGSAGPWRRLALSTDIPSGALTLLWSGSTTSSITGLDTSYSLYLVSTYFGVYVVKQGRDTYITAKSYLVTGEVDFQCLQLSLSSSGTLSWSGRRVEIYSNNVANYDGTINGIYAVYGIK